MGKAFDTNQDEIQGYSKNAIGPFPAYVDAVSVTADCSSCDGKDFCEAFLCEALLVHFSGGLPDQAGLVLGGGARGGCRG